MFVDPHTESRLPLMKGRDVYIPRDEKFGHVKFSDFMGDTIKSISQGVAGILDAIFDRTPKEFDSFQEVTEMFKGGIKLPQLKKIRDNVPTKFLKALFRSDGAPVFKYPLPDIIKGKHLLN